MRNRDNGNAAFMLIGVAAINMHKIGTKIAAEIEDDNQRANLTTVLDFALIGAMFAITIYALGDRLFPNQYARDIRNVEGEIIHR